MRLVFNFLNSPIDGSFPLISLRAALEIQNKLNWTLRTRKIVEENSRNVKWRHIQLCQFRRCKRGKRGVLVEKSGCQENWQRSSRERVHFIKRSVNKVKRETAATTAATMAIPKAHAILPGILLQLLLILVLLQLFQLLRGVQQNIIPKQIWMSNVTELQMKKKQTWREK